MKNGHASVKPLRRADLARATGCNLETIRYYETIGVMPDPPRDANGYRSYGEDHLRRLRFVMRGRGLGFSLEEIRGLLGLVDSHSQTCAEVREIATGHLADVRAKIVDLKQIEKALSETVAQCSGAEVPDCPVIDVMLE